MLLWGLIILGLVIFRLMTFTYAFPTILWEVSGILILLSVLGFFYRLYKNINLQIELPWFSQQRNTDIGPTEIEDDEGPEKTLSREELLNQLKEKYKDDYD